MANIYFGGNSQVKCFDVAVEASGTATVDTEGLDFVLNDATNVTGAVSDETLTLTNASTTDAETVTVILFKTAKTYSL